MTWFLLIIIAVVVIFLLFRPRSRRADLSIFPEYFVVADLETTGLNSENHEIIEIGAIKVNRNSKYHETFCALVKPVKKVPKKITELTGITNEMLERDGRALGQVLPDFLKFVGDARLVFFNAPFDQAFLAKATERTGTRIENPVSCALDMARRAWPGLKSYKLAHLAEAGSLNADGNHRALKDCELTVTVYGAAATKLRCLS